MLVDLNTLYVINLAVSPVELILVYARLLCYIRNRAMHKFKEIRCFHTAFSCLEKNSCDDIVNEVLSASIALYNCFTNKEKSIPQR